MRKIYFLLVVLLQSMFWSEAATAAPCASTSLAGYVALGSGGCTIGSLSFTGFALRSPAAGAVSSTSITVTPILVGTTVAGLSFGLQPTSSGGLYYDDLITYRVTGVAATLVGSTVDFTGSGSTGDAVVSVLEQLCLAGSFGPDGVSNCSSGNALNLAVFNVGGVPDPASASSFGAVSFLTVATDIAFDSGSGFVADSGSTLASAINLFNFVGTRAVPEPAGGLLLAAGVAAWALASRRRSRRIA